MKLNLGCGFNKKDGYINIDKFASCNPDLVIDMEALPWPFLDSEVSTVLFNHSLEHMGASPDLFLGIMKELHRVCQAGATIQINVPHPRHDSFINDPTHVRVINPPMLSLFSKRLNQQWQQENVPNTPLALYLDVDFEVRDVVHVMDQTYVTMLQEQKISRQELLTLINERNNIVVEYQITLEVIK